MKKSTSKERKNSKPKRKAPQPRASLPDEVEPGGLIGNDQPLFFYGPPPAIKTLYKKSGYDKDFHPHDLLKHMQEGSTRSEIVAAWGISYSKFNEWLDVYPELAEAYSVGLPCYEAYYKRAVKLSAFGQLPAVKENSLFFVLKNLAGFDDGGGGHEFSDGAKAELEFVDE